MSYNHGIRVLENPTSLATPVRCTSALQVVFGTAPVNLLDDPNSATNKLIIAYTFDEAISQLGYSDDFENYTLCQSMDATFRVFGVSPIIFCNVLDPTVHKKDVAEASINVTNKTVVLPDTGVLLSTIVAKNGETTLVKDTDYILSFDDSKKAVITLLTSGSASEATSLLVSYSKIDPTMVTTSDIIGGYDTTTGIETGIELVRQVYPKFGLVPGLLLAPGWSQNATVSTALASKCEEINGVFRCMCLCDIDTTQAKKYTDCSSIKDTMAAISENMILLWPMIKIGDVLYYYSAIMAALIEYVDANNDDVPNMSPSNQLIAISGSVLKDGTEINLDQPQANDLNANGIVTAINEAGWKTWGNNTACYPMNNDPKDRWICCRRFFSWWGNTFILTYKSKVDNPANYRLIESIVDSENIRGNSYVSQGKLAGCKIVYSEEENPIEDIINGKIQFKQYIAPYTPAEDILNVLEFDPTMIESALGGNE